MASQTATDVEHISLMDAFEQEWLKLPTAVMRESGPAAQTFAGLLRITNKETFSAVASIAARARLPAKTVRNQLDVLANHGWIVNAGRERTKRGGPRRTCTIRLTKKATDSLDLYGVLPWWACCNSSLKVKGKELGHLPWCAKAVLSIVTGRLMSLRKVAINQGKEYELWDAVEELGGEDKFRFSLDHLEYVTGLSRPSIVNAKNELARRRICYWAPDKAETGGNLTDMLGPLRDFHAVCRNAEKGRCYLEF